MYLASIKLFLIIIFNWGLKGKNTSIVTVIKVYFLPKRDTPKKTYANSVEQQILERKSHFRSNELLV